MILNMQLGDPMWNMKVHFQPQARVCPECGFPSHSPGRLPTPADIPGVWDTSFHVTSPLLEGEALKPPLSTLQRLLDLYVLFSRRRATERNWEPDSLLACYRKGHTSVLPKPLYRARVSQAPPSWSHLHTHDLPSSKNPSRNPQASWQLEGTTQPRTCYLGGHTAQTGAFPVPCVDNKSFQRYLLSFLGGKLSNYFVSFAYFIQEKKEMKWNLIELLE